MVITKDNSSEMRLKDLYIDDSESHNINSAIVYSVQTARKEFPCDTKQGNLNEQSGSIDKFCTLQIRKRSQTASISSVESNRSSEFIEDMSNWSSKPAYGADVTGFQTLEQSKTVIRKNLKFYATTLFIFAVAATAATVIDTQITISLYEKEFNLKHVMANLSRFNLTKQQSMFEAEKSKIKLYTLIEIGLKSTISVLTISTIMALYLYYRNLYRMKIVRNFYPSTMSFFRATPLLKKFIIECVICCLHIPPLLTTKAGIPAKLQLIVVIRLYLLGRYLKEKHELMNSPSTRFLASVTKTEMTSMFLFKTFFMQYPFQLILLAYIILLFIGGYCVWLIEEQYSYLDTVWMLIITMTTVGFGDLTPETMLGRFTVGLAAIVGIFLMALFISLVNEALMLQRREKRILSYVENQDHTRHRKITAINAIALWYRYHSFINKNFVHRNSPTASLITKTRNKKQADIFVIAKAKMLEVKMFKAINLWRKIKESQVSGYFAQEFMIEDMKLMMSDLNTKVEEMDDKMTNITTSLETLTKKTLQKSCEEISRERYKSRNMDGNDQVRYEEQQKPSSNNFKSDADNHHVSSLTISRCNKHKGRFKLAEDSDFYFEQSNNTLSNDIGRYHTTAKTDFNDLLHEKRNGNHKVKLHNGDLRTAFKLLQNQAKIMNTALDDIYHKTKQDISDLENIISSLLLCSEGETNLDHIPTKEIKV